MRRRFVNFTSAFSALLCAAAIGLWVQSYLRSYDLEWSEGSLTSSRGILFCQFALLSGSKPQRGLRFHSLDVFYEPLKFSGPNYLYLHFAGIAFARGDRHVLQFSVPFWVIVLLTGSVLFCLKLLPARRRRAKEESCHSCGYDLTGNVSGICPECGTEIRQRVSN